MEWHINMKFVFTDSLFSVFRTDLAVETDAKLSKVNGSHGVFVGSRVNKGGCWIGSSTAFFLFVYPGSQTYVLSGDLGKL